MSQHHHDLFENRKQFQLERMILFSDAVFAIAITLLVIEIRIPEIGRQATYAEAYQDLMHGLGEKFPEFFGFVLSFWVIGQFWVSHHRMFGYLESYDNRLLWLNLLMLFFIILVPFSSALNSHLGGLNIVWFIYSMNMVMIGVSMYFIWRYIGNPKNKLSYIANDPVLRKMALTRSLSIILIFLLGALLSFFDNENKWMFWISRCSYFLIIPAMMIINRRYQAKK